MADLHFELVTPERIPVEGGFAEVNDKGLTVLAERADVAA